MNGNWIMDKRISRRVTWFCVGWTVFAFVGSWLHGKGWL